MISEKALILGMSHWSDGSLVGHSLLSTHPCPFDFHFRGYSMKSRRPVAVIVELVCFEQIQLEAAEPRSYLYDIVSPIFLQN